ncbi:MAG TPA: TolC family protein [Thermoanaerobaculia bacterium]
MTSSRFRPALHRSLALLVALGLRHRSLPAQAPDVAAAAGLLDVVRLLLENDPNLALAQSQVLAAQGVQRSATGKFDPLLANQLNAADLTAPLTETESGDRRTVQETLSLTQLLRSGLSLTPQLSLLRVADTTLGPGLATVGTLAFTVRQPLLRGRGREVNAAAETAAGGEVAARRLDLVQTTAQRILTTTSQYWTVAAARRSLDILGASEGSARQLLEDTRKLVAVDLTPAAELVQVAANLAAKESSRIGGERALFQARQDLGKDVGLAPDRIAALPLPDAPLPTIAPESLPPAAAGRLVETAIARRADVRAARQRLAESEVLLRAAENELEPQLDLLLSPGYSGLTSGTSPGSFFAAAYRHVPGAMLSFGFSLSWPVGNHAAQGDVIQAQAAREQSRLAVDVLVKGIGADVPSALDAVIQSVRQLERASGSVRLFEQAVANEEKKLRAGTSTLIDVITQRDRLTAAQQDEISARLALALALVQLRFQTGTLLTENGNWNELQAGSITTIPRPEPGAP